MSHIKYLFILLFISTFLSSANISPTQARRLIDSNIDSPNFHILDVRTYEEYKGMHLDESINLDYFSDQFIGIINMFNRDHTFLIYCRSGNRSASTQASMKEMGFTNLYNMLGGISLWVENSYPVISSN